MAVRLVELPAQLPHQTFLLTPVVLLGGYVIVFSLFKDIISDQVATQRHTHFLQLWGKDPIATGDWLKLHLQPQHQIGPVAFTSSHQVHLEEPSPKDDNLIPVVIILGEETRLKENQYGDHFTRQLVDLIQESDPAVINRGMDPRGCYLKIVGRLLFSVPDGICDYNGLKPS